jgi:hypothetical protein
VNRNGTTYTLHLNRNGKSSELGELKPKAQQQLKHEIREMMRMTSSSDIYRLLTATEHWIFGCGSAAEYLTAMEALLSSQDIRRAQDG